MSLRSIRPKIRFVLVLACLGLVASPALAETHVVEVVGFVFDPAELTVNKGDTVRWVRINGSHTTTNGTGAGDPQAGSLWDEGLDSENTEFEYTFDDLGTFPYFCRPHEAFDMKGTITVEEGVPVDPFSWGKLKRMFQRTSPDSRL